MWNSLTEKDRNTIKELQDCFVPKFPEIEPEIIKNRVYDGYCWGEGCLCRIMTTEDWNIIFFGSELQKVLLTCFDDWNDYIKHDGDFHKKLNFAKKGEGNNGDLDPLILNGYKAFGGYLTIPNKNRRE